MAQKRITKSYDQEFKAQAVKLAQEIGGHKAADELGVPKGTIYAWLKAFKEGRLDAKEAIHTPNNAISLNEELIDLRKRVRDQNKKFDALKKKMNGRIKGKISLYCNPFQQSTTSNSDIKELFQM